MEDMDMRDLEDVEGKIELNEVDLVVEENKDILEKVEENNREQKNNMEDMEYVTYSVEGVPIPNDLVRFIVIEKYVPYVSFYDIFKSTIEIKHGINDIKVEDNVMESNLFENNKLLLLGRNKLYKDKIEKVDDAQDSNKLEEGNDDKVDLEKNNRMRLNRLTKISYSHGISWDSLDNLYFEFFKGKTEAYNSWENNKLMLIEFANKVALKKINDTKSLKEFKKSGRLIKLFTQKYYNRWYNCYMEPFLTGMLIKYLKAHVTMAVLNRESQEQKGEFMNLKFRQSEHNPYFKEQI